MRDCFQFVARKHHHDIASHQSTRDRTIRIPCHSIPRSPRRRLRRHFFVSVGGVSLVVAFCLRLSSAFRKASAASVAPSLSRSEDWTTNDDDDDDDDAVLRVTVVPSVLPPLVKSGHDVNRKVSSHQRSGGRDTKILNFFPQTVFVFRVLCTFFCPLSLSLSLSLCPYKPHTLLYRAKHHPFEQRERVIRERSSNNKEGRRSKVTRTRASDKKRGFERELYCL